MGRGRAKAKQTKVARELKYSDGGTDLDALRRELVSGSPLDAALASAAARGDDADDDNADPDDLDDEKFG
jgi:Protein of unknown function (DUF3073)